jgi:hypothetical protein
MFLKVFKVYKGLLLNTLNTDEGRKNKRDKTPETVIMRDLPVRFFTIRGKALLTEYSLCHYGSQVFSPWPVLQMNCADPKSPHLQFPSHLLSPLAAMHIICWKNRLSGSQKNSPIRVQSAKRAGKGATLLHPPLPMAHSHKFSPKAYGSVSTQEPANDEGITFTNLFTFTALAAPDEPETFTKILTLSR